MTHRYGSDYFDDTSIYPPVTETIQPLTSKSKCAIVACVVVGIAGIVIIALGATNIFGPTGSTEFIASIASGGGSVVIAAGGLLWIIISNNKQSDSHSILDESNNYKEPEKIAQIPEKKEETSNLPSIAFGAARWKEHFNVDVGVEPPLPDDIQSLLDSKCPYALNKKIHETHCLVLVPGEVNGKPFDWSMLHTIASPMLDFTQEDIYKNPEKFCKTAFQMEVRGSHWVLLLKQSLDQNSPALIRELEEKHKYQTPNLIEATVAILAHYCMTKERLFSKAPIFCREKNRFADLVVGALMGDKLQIGISPKAEQGLLRVL